MRLLQRDAVGDCHLTEPLSDDDAIPCYAILSHTWGADSDEVTFYDMTNDTGTAKSGYEKIRFCAEQAKQDGLDYFWIDTCCIDKENKAELSHAINSMFRWYRNAAKCYAYLSDVSTTKWRADSDISECESAFRKSIWFTRGWTLQELLAPRIVEFFSRQRKRLGDKESLRQQIYEITGIPKAALHGELLSQFSVNDRLSWIEHRETKREEDRAYSLLGIFGVYMPPIYGEGVGRAFDRLRDEIKKFEECTRDLHVTDPRRDKARIEQTKGGLFKEPYRWIFENQSFLHWRDDPQSRLLWIQGDPGKGKTMLLCGIINELSNLTAKTTLLSYFFCQATDSRINSAAAVLRGLLFMLVSQQPALISHMRKKYDQTGKALFQDANAWVVLCEIFTDILSDSTLPTTYLLVDALDECTSGLSELLHVITDESIARHLKVKWLVTSRNLPNVGQFLNPSSLNDKISLELNAGHISKAVTAFIDSKVQRLAAAKGYSPDIERKVRHILYDKAEDTFLWVSLVCKELESVPLYRTEEVLRELLPGLNLLYDRMIDHISAQNDSKTSKYCKDVLRSTTLAYRPLRLEEIVNTGGLPIDEFSSVDRVADIVSRCGSFLTVRKNIVSFIHLSAKDYFTSGNGTQIFDGAEDKKEQMAYRLVDAMNRTLRRDLCSLQNPGARIQEATGRIKGSVLPQIAYACEYWIEHLSACSQDSHDIMSDDGKAHRFLQEHALHWLEAVSLLKRIPDATAAIRKLLSLLNEDKSKVLFRTICDLLRLLRWGGAIIQEAPLQLYHSILTLAPKNSIIRGLFSQEMPSRVSLRSEAENDWNPLLQTLGHTASVTGVNFSPQGDRLASVSQDHRVRLWDANLGQLLQTLEGHTSSLSSVAFSPQGDRLASASYDTTVRLWDVNTSRLLKTLKGHTDSLRSVAFSFQGDLLASASHDRTVQIWETDTGQALQKLRGHKDWVTSVVFSPKGDRLASASKDRTIQLWDINTGRPLQTLRGHKDWVTDVTFSRRGDRLASASHDHTVRLWNVKTGQPLQNLKGHTDLVRSVVFSPQGDRVASASVDKTIRLWDANTGQPLQTFRGHTDKVWSVAFSLQGDQLASASSDRTVRIWDPSTDRPLQKLKGHTDWITSVAFSSQGDRLASASRDKTVALWDVNTCRPAQTLKGHTDWVTSVAFSPQRDQLASASKDCTIRLWDTNTGQPLQTLRGHEDCVASVAFSPRGDRLASASHDEKVQLWDLITGKPLQTLKGHTDWVTSVAFSPRGGQLASASRDRRVRLWDADTGVPLQTLEEHTHWVTSVAFSPQGNQLASASRDQKVRLWDAHTGQLLQTLEGYTEASSVFQVALVKGQWVSHTAEDILLLPLRFKVSCSIAYESMIALGTTAGRLLVFSFSK